MFELLKSLGRLNKFAFVEKVPACLYQQSRRERQAAIREKQQKEWMDSIEAIACPYSFERITKKWGW